MAWVPDKCVCCYCGKESSSEDMLQSSVIYTSYPEEKRLLFVAVFSVWTGYVCQGTGWNGKRIERDVMTKDFSSSDMNKPSLDSLNFISFEVLCSYSSVTSSCGLV